MLTRQEYRNKLEKTLTRSTEVSTEMPGTMQALQDQLLLRDLILPDKQSVSEFERSLGTKPAVCFFSSKISIMTSLAILLNVGWYSTSPRMMKAGCVFLFFFGIEIIWVIYEILEWATIRTTKPVERR